MRTIVNNRVCWGPLRYKMNPATGIPISDNRQLAGAGLTLLWDDPRVGVRGRPLYAT
jgi:hypothetical protein